MGSYSQFDSAAREATSIALAYPTCKEMVSKKAAELKTQDRSVSVEAMRLWPGWREVVLRITFPDGQGLWVQVDLERSLVNWVKNYW